jgi:hypothetical protein
MTAQKGTHEFSSTQSRNIEEVVKDLILSTIKSWGNKWKLKKEISFSDIFSTNNIAYQKNGKSTLLKPDGGMLFYNNKPVALFEVKYQKARNNACERVFKYIPIIEHLNIERKNFFAFFYGSGFSQNNKGHITGQTGATVLSIKNWGVTVFVNEDISVLENNLKLKLQLLRQEHEV